MNGYTFLWIALFILIGLAFQFFSKVYAWLYQAATKKPIADHEAEFDTGTVIWALITLACLGFLIYEIWLYLGAR